MQPMLATRGDRIPVGQEWIHEVKWDGMRVLVDVAPDGRVRVHSRNENDVTAAWPELQGLASVGRDLLLDGEIVALGDGVPSFGALASRMHVRDAKRVAQLAESNPITLLVFDVLRVDEEDLTGLPLRQRRRRLEGLGLDGPAWQVPPTYDDGLMLREAAEQQGLEGIVSKRLSSSYHPGQRSRSWLKFPIRPRRSFVVGGFRRETGSENRVGAVLVGEPGPDGLTFCGRVGSGVAGKRGQALGELLTGLVQEASPFASELDRIDRIGTIWVDPVVVVDIEFLTRTRDGRLRQPAYCGVRTDLGPADLEEQS